MLRGPRDLPSAARAASSRVLGIGATALLALACATDVQDYTPDADTGSRHAVVSVERSLTVDGDEASAEAFAQFAQVPASDEPASVLRATGVVRDLPAAGDCLTPTELDEFSGPFVSASRVEFLDVGQVTIQAGDAVTALGAHAFPTVSDFASGVVYATRDREAEPLPAGTAYLVNVAGSAAVPAMAFGADAPPPLESVALGGQPLAEVEAVPASQPIDVTWAVGQPGDLVYVEVTTSDESSGILCAFRDEDGVGTIPADVFPASTTAHLSIHRLRMRSLGQTALDTGEMRFDFELATDLELE